MSLCILHDCAYRFFPWICDAIRPVLPPLSVLVTSLCVGAPLALNIKSVLSPFGVVILLLICAFHVSAFITGYALTGFAFHMAPDVKALQRTLSYETGSTFFYCITNIIHREVLSKSNCFFTRFQECKAVFWPLHLQIDSFKIHLLVYLQQSL